MSDSINRQAAVDVIRKCNAKEVTPAYMLIDKEEAMMKLMMLPSAPLYTEAEIQTMQDLEWSQMEKMYELGKVEALQKIQMSLTEPQEEPNAEWRKKHYEMSYNQGFVDACKYYENLPERKKGKWLNRRIVYMDVHIATCDQCGKRVVVGNFCPNCGVNMRGE